MQGRLVSSALVRQLVLEKENSEFKPVKLRIKIDRVSYPVRAEGLVNNNNNNNNNNDNNDNDYLPIQAERPNLVLVNKKKKTWHLLDFAVPVNQRWEWKRQTGQIVG